MGRSVRIMLGVCVILVLIVTPALYALHVEAEFRNFRPVREGVLYRSGQMTPGALKRVVHDYGIRTVVTLRDADLPGEPPPDLKEERWCRRMEINYHRLPPQNWWAPVGPAPVEEN